MLNLTPREKNIILSSLDMLQQSNLVGSRTGDILLPNELKILSNKIEHDSEYPDPDIEYTFACDDCDEKAKWSMNSVVDAGTPICPGCGEDMELQDNKQN